MDRYNIYSSTSGPMTPILQPVAPAALEMGSGSFKAPVLAKWAAGGVGVLLIVFLLYQAFVWIASMMLPLLGAVIACLLLAGAIYKGRELTSSSA